MHFRGIFISKLVFFVCVLGFFLLLFKNPFSYKNLIANFEPFPDTFQYVVPAKSFADNRVFGLVREGRLLEPQVAPLYSFMLIPFYLLNSDPRMFYLANVLLALTSFILFYFLMRKLTGNIWIISLVLFLYVTNYYIYWYPTLAMADNLILTFFLLALWFYTRTLILKPL